MYNLFLRKSVIGVTICSSRSLREHALVAEIWQSTLLNRPGESAEMVCSME